MLEADARRLRIRRRRLRRSSLTTAKVKGHMGVVAALLEEKEPIRVKVLEFLAAGLK